MKHPFSDPKVQAVYDKFPSDIGAMALTIRDLIFDVASDLPDVGRLQEALRWGQPAYLTPDTKSGSTLRIGQAKQGGCAIFAHCQTHIISTYANMFPGTDQIEGNRAVVFTSTDEIDPMRLRFLISHGLTYHLKTPST